MIAVGVHVRRTDFKQWLKSTLGGSQVKKEFFLKGMEILRSRFNSCSSKLSHDCKAVAFLMASDELNWCKENFGKQADVFFSPFTAPELDMSMFHHCDHMFIR